MGSANGTHSALDARSHARRGQRNGKAQPAFVVRDEEGDGRSGSGDDATQSTIIHAHPQHLLELRLQ
jgi:hypothetical protein